MPEVHNLISGQMAVAQITIQIVPQPTEKQRASYATRLTSRFRTSRQSAHVAAKKCLTMIQ